eukprot:jgi/Botrbrau1/22109/Bobra.0206s0035.1
MFVEEDSPYTYRPLELCSCAASLRRLVFEDSWNKAAEAPRPGMLSSLQHLQCLELMYQQEPLHTASLLNGINPHQLTRLRLEVDSLTHDVMKPILHFTQLRDLEFENESASLRTLLQLFSLPSLTRLDMHNQFSDDMHSLSGDAWRVVVEETLEAVRENVDRLRHGSGWPPFELVLF